MDTPVRLNELAGSLTAMARQLVQVAELLDNASHQVRAGDQVRVVLFQFIEQARGHLSLAPLRGERCPLCQCVQASFPVSAREREQDGQAVEQGPDHYTLKPNALCVDH